MKASILAAMVFAIMMMVPMAVMDQQDAADPEIVYESTQDDPENHTTFTMNDNKYYAGYTYKVTRYVTDNFNGAGVGSMTLLASETSSGCTVSNYSYDSNFRQMEFDFEADSPGTYNVTLAYTLTFLFVTNWEWDTYVITVGEDPSVPGVGIVDMVQTTTPPIISETTPIDVENTSDATYINRWYSVNLNFKNGVSDAIKLTESNLDVSVRDISVNSGYSVSFKVLFEEPGSPVLKLGYRLSGQVYRTVVVTFPTVNDAIQVDLDLNGHGSLAKTTYEYVGQTIQLPTPSVGTEETFKFVGWSTSKASADMIDNTIGVRPTKDTTYYAIWEQCKLVLSEQIEINMNTGIIYSKNLAGLVMDNMEPSARTVSNFTLKLNNDETGCMSVSGMTIKGTFSNLIPGSYNAVLNISKSGYESCEVTIAINVAAYRIPTVEENFIQNQTGYVNLALMPTDTTITSIVSVKLNSFPADASYYDASITTNNSISFTGYEKGTYLVTVAATNPSVMGTTISFYLHVIEDTTVGTPSIEDVEIYIPDETKPSTYQFSVKNPINVSAITWFFYIDGELVNNASGTEVQCQFTKPGVYEYNLTIGNKDYQDVEVYSTNRTLEVIYTPDKDTSGFASLNKPYEWSIVSDDPNVSVTFSDNGGSWLTAKKTILSNGKALITVSGTCTDSSFASLPNGIIVLIMKNGTIDTGLGWTIRVTAEVEVEGFEYGDQSASIEINGADLTVKNLYPSGPGISVTIDYDDGNQDTGSSTDTFSHTYGLSGYYRVKVTWTWVSDGTVNQPSLTSTKYAKVTGQITPYTITYHANNVQAEGSMAPQTGKDSYTIKQCQYELEDHVFLGWYATPECDGAQYIPGTQVSIASNLDLYAKWGYDGPVTITLTSEIVGDEYFIRAVSSSINDPTVTWTVTSGSNLISYVTGDLADGGRLIIQQKQNAGTVNIKATSDDDPTKNATIQLYICGILYHSNYDDDSITKQMYISPQNVSHTFSVQAANPRVGFDFQGWTVSAISTDVAKMPGDSVTLASTESKTYYALWRANGQEDPDEPDEPDEPDDNEIQFSIQRDEDLPNVMIISATALDNSVLTFEFINDSIISMEQEGNTWKVKPGMSDEPGTVTVKVTSSTGLSNSMEIHVFVLKYNAKNINPSTWVSEEETHDFTVKSTQPTKEGASFVGWAEYDHSGTAMYISGVTGKDTVHDVGYQTVFNLYPVWSGDAKTYTIKFDTNGSTYGNVENITSTAKNGRCLIQIPVNNLEKTGYKFIRWLDETTGQFYYQGESVLLLEEKPEIKLKAIWAKNSDGVRVVYRDAGSFLTAQNLITGERPTYMPTKEGYFFNGWYKDMALTQPFTSSDVVSGSEYYLNASWVLDITTKRPIPTHQIAWELKDGVYTFSMTGTLDYDPASIEWQFGDGYAFTGATATHKFVGEHTVTAILKNKNGTTEIELNLDAQDDLRDVLQYALIAIAIVGVAGYVFYIKVKL